MPKLYTVKGNTRPTLKTTLIRAGSPLKEIAGGTINLILIRPDGTVSNTGHQGCTITDATKGKVSYTTQAGDFDVTGLYSGKMQITYSDGGYEEVYETFSVAVR